MQKIYKYKVPINLSFFHLVNTERVEETRHFAIRGTGEAMGGWHSTDKYIGTVQIPPFVWHLFETKE